MDNMAADIRRCDEIWQRVRPDLDPYPAVRAERQAEEKLTTDKALKDLIRQAMNDRCYYIALSRKAGNRAVARCLASLAVDKGENMKKLKAAYFILTGDKYAPDTTGLPEIFSFADGLRARYLGETRLALSYRQAAEGAGDAGLTGLLEDLAREAEANALCMWELLSR